MRFTAAGASVLVDDKGIDARTPLAGGTRVVWSAIADVRVSVLGNRDRPRRAVVLSLSDGSPLILPAPRERPGRAAEFDEASRRIIEAYESRRRAAAEPQDQIPPEYRVAPVPPIESYGGVARRAETLVRSVRLGLVVLALGFIAGVVGLCGSVHSLGRDLPAYDSFRSPDSCSAQDAGSLIGTGRYCHVTDGVIDAVIRDPQGAVDALIVGPQAADGNWTDTPTQDAYLPTTLPGDPEEGAHLDYVSQQPGDVASLVWQGTTYQTTESPQRQLFYDLASLIASGAWTLLFGLWFAFRVCRHRYTLPRAYALFTCAAACVCGAVTAGAEPNNETAVPSTVFLPELTLAPTSAALLTVVLARVLRRRGLRPLSPHRRARP